jgi:hypothetical protein
MGSSGGIANPSAFSIILDFKGRAELKAKAELGVSLITSLNDRTAALSGAIAEELRSQLRPQLPSAEVSVTLGFTDGPRWSGVLLISDPLTKVQESAGFSEYVRKVTQTVLDNAIRKQVEQLALEQNAAVQGVVTKASSGKQQIQSRARTNFLWWCAGVVPETLEMYPSERAKYEGIGGAVLTTGVLAFLSGSYAVYTTLASGPYALLTSAGFGILWAIAIFNLDRYIVASLRKPTEPGTRWRRRFTQTWLPAIPRLGLAALIGITLSRPIELRLFHNAIQSQAEINRDQAVAAKRASLTDSSRLNQVNAELSAISAQIANAENRTKTLEDDFRKEADGTGGSLRYGYSEVARVKEAAAQQSRRELADLRASVQGQVDRLQSEKNNTTAQINAEVDAFRAGLGSDFLTRMRALADLSANSPAVWWISTFVMLLIIAVEITPVLVKLLSPVGPYDVKLDAMNSTENHEAVLKRDTTMRVASHHYERTERAELQANDHLFDIQAALVPEALDSKAEQWKKARATGSALTMEQWLAQVRSDVLTQRGS